MTDVTPADTPEGIEYVAYKREWRTGQATVILEGSYQECFAQAYDEVQYMHNAAARTAAGQTAMGTQSMAVMDTLRSAYPVAELGVDLYGYTVGVTRFVHHTSI